MDRKYLKFSDNKFRKKIEPIILDLKITEKEKKDRISSLLVEYLLLGKQLSLSFIRLISPYLDNYYMVLSEHVNLNFLRLFRNKLTTNDLTNYMKQSKNIDLKFFELFKNLLNWTEVSRTPFRFSLDFLLKYKEKIAWWWLCGWYNITLEFIDKFADQDLDWKFITANFDLSEEFIKKHHKHLDMKNIIYNMDFKFSNLFKMEHPLYFLTIKAM